MDRSLVARWSSLNEGNIWTCFRDELHWVTNNRLKLWKVSEKSIFQILAPSVPKTGSVLERTTFLNVFVVQLLSHPVSKAPKENVDISSHLWKNAKINHALEILGNFLIFIDIMEQVYWTRLAQWAL